MNVQYHFSSPADFHALAGSRSMEGARMCAGSDIMPKSDVSIDAYTGENANANSRRLHPGGTFQPKNMSRR